MNYQDTTPKIIEVTGEEAKLIRAAEAVELAAERRAQAEAPEGMVAPMTFFETEYERSIESEKMKLVSKYQMAQNLSTPPILVPVADYAPIQRPSEVSYHPYVQRNLTDMDLANLLLGRVTLLRKGENVYLYNGTYYEWLPTDKFHTLILGMLRKELSINGSSKQIKNVAAAILAEPTIERTEVNGQCRGLCLENGVLDIAGLTLHEHDPHFYFTWRMPVQWYGAQPCPVFDQFLATVTGGDPVLMQRFWEAIGYILVPNDNRAKRFILMSGLGNTGKSVLGNLLRSFFASDCVSSVDIFKMGDRFSLATLARALINISMDLSDCAMSEQAVSMIKQITGGDLVQVEEKYKTPYSTRINCKLIFGTNHKLRTNSWDQAFLNRILLLPFQYPIPAAQQDRHLTEKLMAERSGILYKAIMAYRTLVSNGYIFTGDDRYGFAYAYQPAEETVSQTDTLEQFARECCVEAVDEFIPTDTLFQCYTSFCQNLHQGSIGNSQVFSAKFKGMIQKLIPAVELKKQRFNGVLCNGYKGISLRS